MDKKKIFEFATEYLELYQNENKNEHQVNDDFADKCFALDFKMDKGSSFMEAYPDAHPFNNADCLKAVINQVDDIALLGSAIFTMWRQITHWDNYGDLLSEENRAWFIVAFSRLKGLAAIEERTIILFPDFVALKAEVEKLRTEMSMLLLERDELLFVDCKNIEMAYMLILGGLEYKAYELHCAVLRSKRKKDLIQAKKNRQEKVILSAIDEILNEEFAEYQAQLDEQINIMNEVLERSKGKLLSDEETRELKKLYRSIVKSLHPDLHPDISDEKITLFRNAVSAYENGDLNSLRIISTMVSEPVIPDTYENGMDVLVKEKDRLVHLLKVLRDSIVKIKNEYPYTMKDFVQSEEKIAEKKTELENNIAQLKEALELYNSKIEDMLG